MAWFHYGSARASAVNPARRKGAPLRALGVDRESAAKQRAYHAKNADKRLTARKKESARDENPRLTTGAPYKGRG